MPAPRDAATLILARPTGGGGYEVLMTRRPETMAFMGGTYVFPGGILDEADQGDALTARSALTRDEARDRLPDDLDGAVALGLYCCALRETFEEVGVLLARTQDGDPVDPAVVRERYAPRQRELASDAAAFAAFLAAEGLELATDLLVPHGRLITPEVAPLRFDARFFVAPHPDGQEVAADPVEVTDHVWISPTAALERAGEGAFPVPIPTMAILQGLAEVGSYDQLLAGKQVRRDVEVAKLSPLVTHVLAPNPGLATGAGTNTYVVGTDEVAIIDPAVPDAVYIERVARAAGDRGRPTAILLTHLHPDHTGGVAVLASELGCEVRAWEGAVDQAPTGTKPLADGDELRFGDATLRALYTPGHASHHVCLHLLEERALFAGDVVAGLGTVVIAPPDGHMADYMGTLRRLRELDLGRIYPGHGPVVEDGPAKLDEYIAHRLDRERQVLDALEAGLQEIPAMVERIYADVPESLHAMAAMSVRAHLEMLEHAGRVTHDTETWTLVGEDRR